MILRWDFETAKALDSVLLDRLMGSVSKTSVCEVLDFHKITVVENGGLVTRRNVLIGSGLCAALVVDFPLFGKNEAYAQSPLINAILAGISLAWEIWKIFQPTEGRITIVNRYEIVREGNVVFQVVGPRGVENYAYFPYRIPPRYQSTYEFNDGPFGTFPGQKNFIGRTERGQMATHMVVEA